MACFCSRSSSPKSRQRCFFFLFGGGGASPAPSPSLPLPLAATTGTPANAPALRFLKPPPPSLSPSRRRCAALPPPASASCLASLLPSFSCLVLRGASSPGALTRSVRLPLPPCLRHRHTALPSSALPRSSSLAKSTKPTPLHSPRSLSRTTRVASTSSGANAFATSCEGRTRGVRVASGRLADLFSTPFLSCPAACSSVRASGAIALQIELTAHLIPTGESKILNLVPGSAKTSEPGPRPTSVLSTRKPLLARRYSLVPWFPHI